MDRFKKLLAAATLLVLPVIAACGEDVMPPPPTGSIVGQVSIEGMGIDGVTVSLSNGASTATAGGGNYRFDNVEQGSYTVTISGFPADASFDATSAPANIGDTGGTVPVDFRGTYIRTASIMGTVTVENMGLGGVTVRISGMADSETATDDSGQYSFTGLRAGTYSVEISSFDSNEVSFSSTSGAATVGVGESKVVSFDGTYLRTAGIMGRVSAEGEGLPNVTVTLMGQGDDIPPATTDAGGLYSFSQLRSGDYTVAISGYDTDDYEFETTSKSVTIATGETANVPFEGTLLRTAGIAGRVSLDDGMGLDGVTVTLAGAAEATAETANGGQYSFAGLAAGTYVLSITNPNETAYSFAEDELQKTVMLEDDQSAIVNFSGTHTRTASVSGMLFIDEVMQDKMHNDGEPSVTAALAPLLPMLSEEDQMVVGGLLAKAKVKLRGPDLNTMTDIAINADGTFSTGASLMAGSYQVELPVNDDDVAAGLAVAGVAFVGESMVVTVEAGGSATVNFPFRITMQTVATGARMGAGEHLGVAVPGVKLALYARADGTGMLGEATTDDMGMASFTFARDDNTGPAGNDNIVFVKAVESGHDALVVSGNEFVEFSYEGVERLSVADHDKEVATLVNVAVAFDFWVKSNEMARDGDEGLGDWNTQVYMGDPEADDAMPLMVEEDGEMVNATKPTDDGEEDMDDLGKGSFAYTVDPTDLPAMFTVMATEGDDADQPDMTEKWMQGDALTHTHTGLDLPPGEDDDPTDLGPIRITYTTQAVYVGIHRELDDRTGYTDYLGVDGGDDRPTGDAIDEIEVSLMVRDSRGYRDVLMYDHDFDDETDDIEATATFDDSGMVSFAHIPADTEIVVEVEAPSGMMIVPERRSQVIEAFGDELDDYPDGKMVGAFGDGSGARPDVWLCPLQRQTDDDPNEVCSTFAYKWDDGKISGSIDGLRKGDEDVMVTLTPRNSNDEYAKDLEDDEEVEFGDAGFTFSEVADGRYWVKLEGVAGKWKADSVSVTVVHDEDDPNERGAADIRIKDKELSATQLRLAIQGVVANDRNGDGTVSSTEAEEGVVLKLFKASVPRSGSNRGKAVKGAAVEDDDGDPVTATTDRDGIYAFTQLVEGQRYIVEAVNVPGSYKVVRERNSLAIKADDYGMVSQAYVAAASDFDPDFTGGTPPEWDHARSKIVNAGTTNFALLWDNGTAYGKVSDPSVRAAHKEATVELYRCLTVATAARDLNGDGDDTDAGEEAITDATPFTCASEASARPRYASASVNARGNWEVADELLEGYYEVSVRMPRGYTNSTNAGASTGTAGTDGYYETQIDSLTTGRRASDGTETFHIVLSGADNTDPSVAPNAVLKDGSRTIAATGGYVGYTTTSVSATLSHGTGAATGTTYKVVYSATNKVSFAVGVAGTWARLAPGSNTLSVDAAAPSGYSTTNFPTVRTLHRDRDTRLTLLDIDIPGAGNNVIKNRDALEDISGFLAAEGRRTDELAPANISGGDTPVDLGTVATFKRPATGTLSVSLQANAFGEGVTVTGADSQELTAGSGNETLTFTITLTDDDRAGNARRYTFKVVGTP